METFSTRQNKVGKLIQKELSNVFLKESSHVVHGKMITITVIRMSPDLSLAKVYFSIFPNNKTKETLDVMNAEKKQIRMELGKKIRHQLRIVPELAFFVDDSLDYADKINKLLLK